MLNLNLQLFGGRGSGGGNNPGSAANRPEKAEDIFTEVSKAAKSRWEDKFVPLTEKDTNRLKKTFDSVDSADFSSQSFGEGTDQKVEGIPGKLRFIKHSDGDFEIQYKSGGLTHGFVSSSKSEVISQAKREIKRELVNEALWKRRKK